MAEVCASCGRAGLVQADVRNLQCLGCGALTDIASSTVVTPREKPAVMSNAGLPVVELSSGVVMTSDPGEDRRLRPIGPQPEIVVPREPEPRPARIDPGYVLEDTPTDMVVEPHEVVDLSTLSPEQAAEIESIIHGEA